MLFSTLLRTGHASLQRMALSQLWLLPQLRNTAWSITNNSGVFLTWWRCGGQLWYMDLLDTILTSVMEESLRTEGTKTRTGKEWWEWSSSRSSAADKKQRIRKRGNRFVRDWHPVLIISKSLTSVEMTIKSKLNKTLQLEAITQEHVQNSLQWSW